MIQRIQSVWLLLAAVCALLSFKLPYYIGTLQSTNTTDKLTGTSSIPITLVTVVVATLAVLTIFLFKKRKQQILLCLTGILLQALLIFLYWQKTSLFVSGTGSYALWALLQAAAIAFFMLAARAISKDEKMVKDSDRLR